MLTCPLPAVVDTNVFVVSNDIFWQLRNFRLSFYNELFTRYRSDAFPLALERGYYHAWQAEKSWLFFRRIGYCNTVPSMRLVFFNPALPVSQWPECDAPYDQIADIQLYIPMTGGHELELRMHQLITATLLSFFLIRVSYLQ